jgi:hypothetical protein
MEFYEDKKCGFFFNQKEKKFIWEIGKIIYQLIHP